MSRQVQLSPEEEYKALQLELINIVCTALLKEPKYFHSSNEVADKIRKAVHKIANHSQNNVIVVSELGSLASETNSLTITGAEFILQLALYVRSELGIRSTANFLVALAATEKNCHPFILKYFNSIVRLPTDMLEICDLFNSLAVQDHYTNNPNEQVKLARLINHFPAALRTAIELKFATFDEFQLAKHNTEKRYKRKSKRVAAKEKKHEEWVKKMEEKFGKLSVDELKEKSKKGKKKGNQGKPDPASTASSDSSNNNNNNNANAVAIPEIPLTTMKFLIKLLHISAPAELVMKVLNKKYPATPEQFKKSKLPGEFDEKKVGTKFKLTVPETWETQTSEQGNNPTVWEGLLDNNKLTLMAILRNLRNMIVQGISYEHHQKVLDKLQDDKTIVNSNQLPFSFLSAYEAVRPIRTSEDLAGSNPAEVEEEFYTAVADKHDRKELEELTKEFDSHGNPIGSAFDLGQDGKFTEYSILIGRFYSPCDTTKAKEALAKKGFKITETMNRDEFVTKVEEHNAVQESTGDRKINIIWLISNCTVHNDSLATRLTNAVVKFHQNGGGMCLWGDNDPYYADVNPILKYLYNVEMKGNTPGNKVLSLGNATTTGQFGRHKIFSGIWKLYEGITICYPSGPSKLQVIATSTDGNPVILCSEDGPGRVVVECAFTKLYCSWDSAGTARYVSNLTVWLANVSSFNPNITPDPRKVHYMPNNDLKEEYKRALDTSVRISLNSNLKPMTGKTVILVDVSASMRSRFSSFVGGGSCQQLRDLAVIFGLMLHSACLEGELYVFSSPRTGSNSDGFIRINLSNPESMLANVEVVTKQADTLGGPCEFPQRLFDSFINNKQHIERFVVISDLTSESFQNTIVSTLDKYRQKVNDNAKLVVIDVYGKGNSLVRRTTDQSAAGQELNVMISGLSDKILRFVSESNSAQLDYILKIQQTKAFKKQRVSNNNNNNNNNNNSN